MKFVVSITFRLNGYAAENEVAARRILDMYSKWAAPASMTFHQFVARVDGGGGFCVMDTDNPADLMEITSKFAPFADYEIYPVVDIADGVRVLQEAAEFRRFLWWPGSQSPPAIRRRFPQSTSAPTPDPLGVRE
jgi:Protein of unknown function (DUF3303)